MRKAQASMEYIIIVSFVFIILSVLLVLYYDYKADATDSIKTSQSLKIARMISDQAETIFYLGEPSRTILKLNFPDGIENIEIGNYEIVFKLHTVRGFDDTVVGTSVNVTGTLSVSSGIHHVIIESRGDYVQIRE